MIKIGIDFSINSPSMMYCKDDGEYHFVSFFNDEGKDWKNSKAKTFRYHNLLFENNVVEMIPYTRLTISKDYRQEQKDKMEDAMKLALLIINKIKSIVIEDEDVKIGLEGFSFGSKGASYIDLIMYNCFLRYKIVETFGPDSLVIVSPSEGKKLFSGKGNANKEKMIESFISNFIGDEKIENTELWKFCSSNELDYNNIKPIDDLIDSCGIFENLKTGCSGELFIMKTFETEYPVQLEKMLHKRFFGKRQLNEWFKLDLDDISGFSDICKKYDEIITSFKNDDFYNTKGW